MSSESGNNGFILQLFWLATFKVFDLCDSGDSILLSACLVLCMFDIIRCGGSKRLLRALYDLLSIGSFVIMLVGMIDLGYNRESWLALQLLILFGIWFIFYLLFRIFWLFRGGLWLSVPEDFRRSCLEETLFLSALFHLGPFRVYDEFDGIFLVVL